MTELDRIREEHSTRIGAAELLAYDQGRPKEFKGGPCRT
jgi:hypothetical protein